MVDFNFRCLDSILHAEHKSILEEMRVDYDVTHSANHKETFHENDASEGSLTTDVKDSAIDLSEFFGYSTKNMENASRFINVVVNW